jgi:hypothetical protein
MVPLFSCPTHNVSLIQLVATEMLQLLLKMTATWSFAFLVFTSPVYHNESGLNWQAV